LAGYNPARGVRDVVEGDRRGWTVEEKAMNCGRVQGLLADYAAGMVTGEEAEVLEAHVATCRSCAAKLETARRKDMLISAWQSGAAGLCGRVFAAPGQDAPPAADREEAPTPPDEKNGAPPEAEQAPVAAKAGLSAGDAFPPAPEPAPESELEREPEPEPEPSLPPPPRVLAGTLREPLRRWARVLGGMARRVRVVAAAALLAAGILVVVLALYPRGGPAFDLVGFSGNALSAGRSVTVCGVAPAGAGALRVELVGGEGKALAATNVAATDGAFVAALPVPETLAGRAGVNVTGEDVMVSLPVTARPVQELFVDAGASDDETIRVRAFLRGAPDDTPITARLVENRVELLQQDGTSPWASFSFKRKSLPEGPLDLVVLAAGVRCEVPLGERPPASAAGEDGEEATLFVRALPPEVRPGACVDMRIFSAEETSWTAAGLVVDGALLQGRMVGFDRGLASHTVRVPEDAPRWVGLAAARVTPAGGLASYVQPVRVVRPPVLRVVFVPTREDGKVRLGLRVLGPDNAPREGVVSVAALKPGDDALPGGWPAARSSSRATWKPEWTWAVAAEETEGSPAPDVQTDAGPLEAPSVRFWGGRIVAWEPGVVLDAGGTGACTVDLPDGEELVLWAEACTRAGETGTGTARISVKGGAGGAAWMRMEGDIELPPEEPSPPAETTEPKKEPAPPKKEGEAPVSPGGGDGGPA
jgi:hypothetical protein